MKVENYLREQGVWFERHVDHSATLTAAAEPQVGGFLLDGDERYVSAV